MVPKKSGCSRYGKQYLFLKNSTWIGPLEGVLGVPGELPKMSIYTFLGGEFVHGIEWNGVFLNWATSRRWGVGIVLCYFFVVFRSLLFAKQWGEYAIKTNCFFNNSDIGIFGFQWKNDAENVISGGEINFEVNPSVFLILLLFGKCLEIECVHECSELMEKREWAF